MKSYFETFNLNLAFTITFFVFGIFFIEILTGISKARNQQQISSRVGTLSFFKNLRQTVGIVLFSVLFIAVPNTVKLPVLDLDICDVIASGVAIIYVYYLIVSITENLRDAGKPVPRFITDFLGLLKVNFIDSSLEETARNVKKTADIVKNPKQTINMLTDDKDDLSTSKPTEPNQPQDTKKDPQEAPDESHKTPEPVSAEFKEDK